MNDVIVFIGNELLEDEYEQDRPPKEEFEAEMSTLHAIAKEAIEALMSKRLEISSPHALIPAPVREHTTHKALLDVLYKNIAAAVTLVQNEFEEKSDHYQMYGE